MTVTQILGILSKAQKLNITTKITEFNGDFMIEFFPEIYGRSDMTDSITITKEDIWKGYGWTFEDFVRVLDVRISKELEELKDV